MNIFIKKEIFTMEQVYKGYATFDAMTRTDFFFRTDAKKRSAGMLKAAAECIVDHRLRRGLKLETAAQYDAMRNVLVKRMQELKRPVNGIQAALAFPIFYQHRSTSSRSLSLQNPYAVKSAPEIFHVLPHFSD